MNHILFVASDGFDDTAIDWLKQTVEDELALHLEYLFNKNLPPFGSRGVGMEVNQTIHRLEERYLRELKIEEVMKFSDTQSDGLPEEPDDHILEINQRIKRNEIARNFLTPNVVE